jgi:hypothetical protein
MVIRLSRTIGNGINEVQPAASSSKVIVYFPIGMRLD